MSSPPPGTLSSYSRDQQDEPAMNSESCLLPPVPADVRLEGLLAPGAGLSGSFFLGIK